jgi:hypothetical protein
MASRSVKCTLFNNSPYTLQLKQSELKHGIWSQGVGGTQTPTPTISAAAIGTWASESNGFMTGTEGWALFEVLGDGSMFEVSWDNPFIGKNSYTQTRRPKVAQSGTPSGTFEDNATVTFTFDATEEVAAPPPPSAPPPPPPPPPSGSVIVAQAKCGEANHVSPPAGSKDVMIIPKQSTIVTGAEGEPGINNATIQDQNWRFAQQWVAEDKDHRTTIEVPVDGTWKDFETAMMAAAKIAKGREIILLTGHGGTKGIRGRSATAFDTIPENKGLSVHKQTIPDSIILELPRVSTLDGDMFKPIPPNSMDMVNSYETAKYVSLRNIGREFKANGVARFTGLTCNVGQDSPFSQSLADLLQVEFRAYKNGVATNDVLGQVQIWVTDDEDHPSKSQPDAHNNKNDPTFHEIPTHLQIVFTPRCK